jgi:very-short-patch-repair endonuclease
MFDIFGGLVPETPNTPLAKRWDDMERDIDLGLDGYLTLRFPAWFVRTNPEYVAGKILEALRRAGYRG